MPKLLLAALLAVAGCKTAATDDSDVKDMFANTRRRPASEAEMRGIGEFLNASGQRVCTAFFVANSGGKGLVGVARHCAGFDLTTWCNGNGQVRDRSTGETGKCKRIVAGDSNHDIALVEVTLATPHDQADTYSLAAYVPKSGTRLKMVGFPSDIYAQGGDTVSENCWLLVPQEADGNVGQGAGNYDKQGRHNCSTYGGNSGGPIAVEGTREVIGLPSTYTKDDYEQRDPNTDNLSFLDSMHDFVSTFRATLTAEGVTLVDTQTTKGTPGGDYLATGRYTSTQITSCDMYLKPLFMSGNKLSQIQVDYVANPGGSCAGERVLKCNAGYCSDSPQGIAFTVVDGTSYYYTNLSSNNTALYKLK